MARKQTLEVRCDRCKRVEYIDSDKAKPSSDPALILTFTGDANDPVEIAYDDLCNPCRNTVGSYVEKITKELEGKSPQRRAREKGPDVQSRPSLSTQTSAGAASSASTAGAAARDKTASVRPSGG